MLNSLNDARRNLGVGILKDVASHTEQKNCRACRETFEASSKLFKSLVDLAGADPGNSRRVQYTFPSSEALTRLLVPIKSALHVCIPGTFFFLILSSFLYASFLVSDPFSDPGVEFSAHNVFPSDQIHIKSFNQVVEVAASKAKPKILSLETTCGRKIKFLCKQEKNGDLRKDAHMMEINGVINRLLQEDPEGRRRCVRLRTFSVICLNEECGILEWVDNTSTLRNLIKEAHSFWAEAYPFIDTREFHDAFKRNQEENWCDIELMTTTYKDLVLSKYRPYLHRWFLEKYNDPTEWMDARMTFTRSTAIWSVVGHIVGLGDRHTENILVDTMNGELVHVDFDCLFDKGLTLQRPEIVPFRLTPNVVDAMGVCGIEGVFRKTMEMGMFLLRGNKDTLLSILEPFLRDPTVAWSRSGRAQQYQQQQQQQQHKQSRGFTRNGGEHDNADAKDALLKISSRLDGVYNIYHPRAPDISKACSERGIILASRGLGAKFEDSLPLSVQGQVQRLIDEGTDDANLAQMFLGWTGWL